MHKKLNQNQNLNQHSCLRTAHTCVHVIVHNCHTEQLWWFSLLSSSVPSGILIHPTIWPQYTNVTDRQDNSSIAQGELLLVKVVQKRWAELTNNDRRSVKTHYFMVVLLLSEHQFGLVVLPHAVLLHLLLKYLPLPLSNLSSPDVNVSHTAHSAMTTHKDSRSTASFSGQPGGPTKSCPEPTGAIRSVWTPPGHHTDAVWISRCDAVLRLTIFSRISFCIAWSVIIFHVRLVHDKMKVLSK